MSSGAAEEPIRVVLADDHAFVREVVKAIVGTMRGVEVIAEAQDGCELLKVLEKFMPDVVITDLSMPRMDGLDAIVQIRRKYPLLPVLAFTMNEDVQLVTRAIAAGASGYVMKNCHPQELEQAIRSGARFGSYFSPCIAQALLQLEPDQERADGAPA